MILRTRVHGPVPERSHLENDSPHKGPRPCPRTKPLGEWFSAQGSTALSPNEATWRMVLRTRVHGPVPERSHLENGSPHKGPLPCPRTKPLGEWFSAEGAAALSPNEATWRMVLRRGGCCPVPERSHLENGSPQRGLLPCPRTKPLGKRFSEQGAAALSPNEATWKTILRTRGRCPVPERSHLENDSSHA